MKKGFPGKPGRRAGIDPGRGSNTCKGLEGRGRVSLRGWQLIPRDQHPECEGKVTEDEASTCSEGVLGVGLTWSASPVGNITLENARGQGDQKGCCSTRLQHGRMAVGGLKHGGSSGERGARNNLRVI